ncbi:MAG TPA: hypothetical protein VMB81_26265 [Candidatus Sulfotelmatobacter sp.]|nr:hypothetical protein [Candidatus Sulfotelmatobacter sp.]
MRSLTKIIANHPMAGTWASIGDEDSTREFTVSVSRNGDLFVSGIDRSDGEAFVISDVAWEGKAALRFEALMPSTGHRTRNLMRLLADGDLVEFQLTLSQPWRRSRPRRVGDHPLAGAWGDDDTYGRIEVLVKPVASGLLVSGRSRRFGERHVISDVHWDGTTLSFSSLVPSTGQRTRHALHSPPDGDTVRHELTLIDLWQRKEVGGREDDSTSRSA